MKKSLIAGISGLALSLMLTGSTFACHRISDGEVTKVDSKSNTVVVSANKAEKTFTVAEKTKVLINGKAGSLADLKTGDKVSVDFEAANDVLSITATRAS